MYCDISIFQLDQRVRQCAVAVQDSFLLGKHVGGDMIAAEAKYHATRLLSLYPRAAQVSGGSRHLVWGGHESPEAPSGVRCGEGVSRSPLEVGMGFFNLLF